MKGVRGVTTVVLGAALAAFTVHGGPEPGPDGALAAGSAGESAARVGPRTAPDVRPSPRDVAPARFRAAAGPHGRTTTPGGRDTIDTTRPAPTPVERDDDDRRSRRWRHRNRYPGPIPTPEDWAPPAGPVRIGLQVGHWRTEEAPRELDGLRGGGTRWQGTPEWKVNLEIARRAAALLEEQGYAVDLLPAVVPPGYRAHLFISVHADGSGDPNATGYRVAAPRRDATGRASGVVELLERTYGDATGLGLLPTVTRRMRNYYAFNFRRYEHALHPMTIAVILETGFLTSARDRRVLVDAPERAARGIVDAVLAFPVTRLPSAAEAASGASGG